MTSTVTNEEPDIPDVQFNSLTSRTGTLGLQKYTLEEVKIKDVVLRLIAVHQMDMREAHLVLTGQRIWPAAKVLALYLVENPHIVQSAMSVLELGAGPGLPGLVAARLAPQPERVVLTDNKDLVLDLLDKNIMKNFNGDDISEKPRCEYLEWGKGVADFRNLHGGFDVILASDVIYHRPDIPLLLQTAKDLLNDKPSSALLLSYNDRARIFERTVKETAQACGLEWTDIPFRKLLPDFSQIVHPDEVRHLHLMVIMKGGS